MISKPLHPSTPRVSTGVVCLFFLLEASLVLFGKLSLHTPQISRPRAQREQRSSNSTLKAQVLVDPRLCYPNPVELTLMSVSVLHRA